MNGHFDDVTLDELGNFWIASLGPNAYGYQTPGGVAMYDGSSWTIYNTSNSGLAHNETDEVDVDLLGNKWFSTKLGVSKFNGTTWTTYTYANTNGGLSSDHPDFIYIDRMGNKWFGRWSVGVTRFCGD